MSDEDISLDEKRVFEERRGVALAFVASGIGLARVEISDDQIGRFGLVHRGTATDVAVNTHEGTAAVATADDVLVGNGEEFNQTGFGGGGAVAVAVREIGNVYGIGVFDTVSLVLILGSALLVSGAVVYSSVTALRNEARSSSTIAD